MISQFGVTKASSARIQQPLCKRLLVSLRSGMLNPDEAKYANGVLVALLYPTDDICFMTKVAMDAVD